MTWMAAESQDRGTAQQYRGPEWASYWAQLVLGYNMWVLLETLEP
jgi:hypothetical protein